MLFQIVNIALQQISDICRKFLAYLGKDIFEKQFVKQKFQL